MIVTAALIEPDPKILILAALALGAWYLILAGTVIVRWPKMPEADRPSSELRQETPAVANLLTNGWLVNEDALPATLLDLAARGFVSIEDRGDGVIVCKLRQGGGTGGLRPYEKRVLDHLRSRARDGVVPAGALTTGTQERAKSWWKDFRKEVSADAKESGLARELWPGHLSIAMFVAGSPIYLLLAWAQDFKDSDQVQSTPLLLGVTYAMWAAVVILFLLAGTARLRDTHDGRIASARWLGIRKSLKTLPSFPDLPPDAVATWERHLAYGAALGVAGDAARSLPLGAERDRRAWSHYGGQWRSMEVRYPRFRPGWGTNPGLAVLLGVVRMAGVVFFLYIANKLGLLPGEAFSGGQPPWLTLGVLAFVTILLAVALYSFVEILYGVMDFTTSTLVEGEVVRTRVKTRFGSKYDSDDEARPLYFVAVYQGKGDRVLAWRVNKHVYPSFYQGQAVRVEVTPRLSYVKRVVG